MRVAIFFDGSNSYAGWRETAGGRRVDFAALSRWLVARVGGSSLWGVHYYTAEAPPGDPEGLPQAGLSRFLEMLEHQPGFFVRRFPRRGQTAPCPACGHQRRTARDKEVDTTLVADMLTLAAVSAYDLLVLVSGDADFTPAVEGVRRLGLQAWVATWGGHGLSGRLRRAAFDHVDLLDGADAFLGSSEPEGDERGGAPYETSEPDDEAHDLGITELFLTELRRAEAHFGSGYVGANYFITRWQSSLLSESSEVRRRVLDRLLVCGQVEMYTTGAGDLGLRCSVLAGVPEGGQG